MLYPMLTQTMQYKNTVDNTQFMEKLFDMINHSGMVYHHNCQIRHSHKTEQRSSYKLQTGVVCHPGVLQEHIFEEAIHGA